MDQPEACRHSAWMLKRRRLQTRSTQMGHLHLQTVLQVFFKALKSSTTSVKLKHKNCFPIWTKCQTKRKWVSYFKSYPKVALVPWDSKPIHTVVSISISLPSCFSIHSILHLSEFVTLSLTGILTCHLGQEVVFPCVNWTQVWTIAAACGNCSLLNTFSHLL